MAIRPGFDALALPATEIRTRRAKVAARGVADAYWCLKCWCRRFGASRRKQSS